MLGERIASLVDVERVKLGAACVLLAPFLPMLFMGEEYGVKKPFPYFIHHSDDKLVAAVRKGRCPLHPRPSCGGGAHFPQVGGWFGGRGGSLVGQPSAPCHGTWGGSASSTPPEPAAHRECRPTREPPLSAWSARRARAGRALLAVGVRLEQGRRLCPLSTGRRGKQAPALRPRRPRRHPARGRGPPRGRQHGRLLGTGGGRREQEVTARGIGRLRRNPWRCLPLCNVT